MIAPGHFSARPAGGIDTVVLRQMAEDAMDFRKLVNGTCRACEDGHPCAECVMDEKRLREYQAVLDALGDEAA